MANTWENADSNRRNTAKASGEDNSTPALVTNLRLELDELSQWYWKQSGGKRKREKADWGSPGLGQTRKEEDKSRHFPSVAKYPHRNLSRIQIEPYLEC